MKEEEIRKRDVLNRYLKLVEDDCERFLDDQSTFQEFPCPACGSGEYERQFNKCGFDYVTCDNCRTLYVRNRPNLEKLKDFYDRSASTIFWINNFFKPVAEARREKIFKPRAGDIVNRYGKDPEWLIGDIGAGFGLFLDELRKLWPSSRYVAIEPSSEQAELCKGMNFIVEYCFFEELSSYDNCFDLLTAFELFEHLYDPIYFLKAAYRMLRPGGRLLLTTLNGEGFDIQLLWEKSKSIYPPCHINFFNPASISSLLNSVGFTLEEIGTPGQLDWDIVEGMICNEGMDLGRFWKFLAAKSSPETKHAFQSWLRENCLSSHMRILARK